MALWPNQAHAPVNPLNARKMSIDIIKPLLRKWLKKRVASLATRHEYGPPTEVFKWVYDSPVRQWRDRLWCIGRANSRYIDEIKEFYDYLTDKSRQ